MRIVMVEPVGKDQLGQCWGLTVECKVDHGFLDEDGEFEFLLLLLREEENVGELDLLLLGDAEEVLGGEGWGYARD